MSVKPDHLRFLKKVIPLKLQLCITLMWHGLGSRESGKGWNTRSPVQQVGRTAGKVALNEQ
jgi:hypothetical protein